MRSNVTVCSESGRPKATAILGASAHPLQHAFAKADEAHAVMDAAGPEAPLRDFESAPLAQKDVADRHAHVVEDDLGSSIRHAVEAQHGQRSHNPDARRVFGNENHRLPGVAVRAGRVRLSHEDNDLATGVRRAGGVPFAAVDDIISAVPNDRAGYVGRVGGGDVRFGHREGRSDFARQQRLQPTRLLRFVSIAKDRLHVAGIRRVAVEDFGRQMRPSHDLAQGRVIEVAEAAGLGSGQK